MKIPAPGSYVMTKFRFSNDHRDTCDVFERILHSNCLTLQRYEGTVKHTEDRYIGSGFGVQHCIGPRYPQYGDVFYHFKLPIRSETVYDLTGQSLVSAYYERHELRNINLNYMEELERNGVTVNTDAVHNPFNLEWVAEPTVITQVFQQQPVVHRVVVQGG